ncbi:MAG: fluoride efflux transporter CrcB [Nisaea sp.]|nr:fluoride efflux transporter CrcB [Nisaea sp.]
MNMLLAVALGGAVGAVLRYKITLWSAAALGAGFPYGTLFVNVVGAFAMGVVVQWLAARGGVDPALKAMVTTGLLGALTTFSTFSFDAFGLATRGQMGLAAFYVAASVALSLVALVAGMVLVKGGLP